MIIEIEIVFFTVYNLTLTNQIDFKIIPQIQNLS